MEGFTPASSIVRLWKLTSKITIGTNNRCFFFSIFCFVCLCIKYIPSMHSKAESSFLAIEFKLYGSGERQGISLKYNSAIFMLNGAMASTQSPTIPMNLPHSPVVRYIVIVSTVPGLRLMVRCRLWLQSAWMSVCVLFPIKYGNKNYL